MLVTADDVTPVEVEMGQSYVEFAELASVPQGHAALAELHTSCPPLLGKDV